MHKNVENVERVKKVKILWAMTMMMAMAMAVIVFSVSLPPQVYVSGTIIRDFESAPVFITSLGQSSEAKEMRLKAIPENGTSGSRIVGDFEITLENIIAIEQDGMVLINSSTVLYNFTGARTTEANGSEATDIPISDGRISFAGYEEGAYVLDVTVSDHLVYEAIVEIGEIG